MTIFVDVEIRSKYQLCNGHQGNYGISNQWRRLVALIDSNYGVLIAFRVIRILQNDVKDSNVSGLQFYLYSFI